MSTLRADAQRNLERVLDAATEVFAVSGPDASVDEIARRAGVGHATVFRRFPTKADLMYAVVERHVDELRSLAEKALALPDPGEAFFGFVRGAAELGMTLPGLQKCVVECGEKPGAAELEQLMDRIVSRAQRAGAVRRDLKPRDVGSLIRAALFAAPPEQWRSYLDVVLEGLKPAASR